MPGALLEKLHFPAMLPAKMIKGGAFDLFSHVNLTW